jgi:hypothetical protein
VKAVVSLMTLCLLALLAAPAAASTPLGGATAVSTGDLHACAVVNGGVKCWGANEAGQLGDGTETHRAIAVDVTGLPAGSNVTAIAAGFAHTCAVVDSGVKCWGRNAEGQLGTGMPSLHATTPVSTVTLGPGSGVTSIAAGQFFTCAVANGGVLCWGTNYYAVGIPSAAPQLVIPFGSGATMVSAGDAHACAVVNGGVQCWGYGGFGQLGNGAYGDSASPVVALPVGSGVTAVSAGYGYSCAIAGGAPVCWGGNAGGELGNGDHGWGTGSPVPAPVLGGIQAAADIAAGGHSCAIATGGVQCWGHNLFGPLGTGTWDSSFVPVQVVGLGPGTGATDVHTGLYFTCAVVNGGVQCWGYGEFGELGNGAFVSSSVPVTVVVDDPPVNTAPDLFPVEITPGAVVVTGAAITATAAFTDPDPGDAHTCQVAWGDGGIDTPAAEVSGCGASHAYASPGVYVVTVSATDAAGASDSSAFSYVVAYDPAAGSVTGGGWFESPEGAYRVDPSLTGRAQFGFVARYRKGATVPEGHTEFHFTTAGLTFGSADYEWLVVSGSKATYKGTGRINGAGDYGFMLSVVDGDLLGAGGDRIRLRLWDRISGGLIYDNQVCGGADDDADACTVLGGGGIVIHDGKR